MLGKIRLEFQCLESEARIPMLGKIRLEFQCFGGIRSEFQSLKRYSQNSNVWKDKDRTPMFAKIRTEFQCLEG